MSSPEDRVGGAGPEVTIGLLGSRAAVQQMQRAMTELTERGDHGVRFLTGAHRDMDEAKEKFTSLAGRIDAALFPGPMHFDLAEAEQWPTVPSSFVKVRGAALYAALLRATLDRGLTGAELAGVSVDSLSAFHVTEALDELGLPTDRSHALPYAGPDSVAEFTEFHRRLLEGGQSNLALTTVRSVWQELTAEGRPVALLQPTNATVRNALRSAIAQARGARLGEQQLSLAAVQLLSGDRGTMTPTYWQQSAALQLHTLLLEQANSIGAMVTRRSDTIFLVTMTHGGLAAISDRLRRAPFVAAVRDRLNLPLAVGLGTGRTAAEAETNAIAAMESSVAGGGDKAVLIAGGERPRELPAGDDPARDPAAAPRNPWPAPDPRDVQTLRKLLIARGGAAPIIDVEEAGAALKVTERSGRRILKSLVDAGLAWQLPGQPPRGGGRPRQRFQLLPERLPDPPTPEG